jgi:Fe2+ or Zn2+ uptake regulation protein
MGTRTIKDGNFHWVNNAILDEYGQRLGPYGLAVYQALCRHANNKSQECWPSKALLARETGMSFRSVRNALLRLEELGLIVIIPGGGEGNTNTYILTDAYMGGMHLVHRGDAGSA